MYHHTPSTHHFLSKKVKKAIFWIVLIAQFGCASFKQMAIRKDAAAILKSSPVFSSHITGFCLYDLEDDRLISSLHPDWLFTPASTTKLLTMYVTLKSFRQNIPAGRIQEVGDTLYVDLIGDPSFLHPSFSFQPAFEAMQGASHVALIDRDEMAPFGPGWAWDDYAYGFQPERSRWPIYGNRVTFKDSLETSLVMPSFFEDFSDVLERNEENATPTRERFYNKFTHMQPTQDAEVAVQRTPFITSKALFLALLADTLQLPLSITSRQPVKMDTLFSQPVDGVLAAMMKPSDNFLAEQLLLLAAWQNGFSDTQAFISFAKKVWLTELDEMMWVDGSGLSRYNLTSPINHIRLLKKCIEEFGWDRVTSILATGGEGTLKHLYQSEQPYIFGKTGTLSNNHSLAGLLVTDSGKKLLFSLMNNHYLRPTHEIKSAMEAFLIQIKEAY